MGFLVGPQGKPDADDASSVKTSQKTHRVKDVLRQAVLGVFTDPENSSQEWSAPYAWICVEEKIFSSFEEWELFLHKEDTLDIYALRNASQWISFVYSQMRKLAVAQFVKMGAHKQQQWFSTVDATNLISYIDFAPCEKEYMDYIHSQATLAPVATTRVPVWDPALLRSLSTVFWKVFKYMAVLLLFYCDVPNAAFVFMLHQVLFSYHHSTKPLDDRINAVLRYFQQKDKKFCLGNMSRGEKMDKIVNFLRQIAMEKREKGNEAAAKVSLGNESHHSSAGEGNTVVDDGQLRLFVRENVFHDLNRMWERVRQHEGEVLHEDHTREITSLSSTNTMEDRDGKWVEVTFSWLFSIHSLLRSPSSQWTLSPPPDCGGGDNQLVDLHFDHGAERKEVLQDSSSQFIIRIRNFEKKRLSSEPFRDFTTVVGAMCRVAEIAMQCIAEHRQQDQCGPVPISNSKQEAKKRVLSIEQYNLGRRMVKDIKMLLRGNSSEREETFFGSPEALNESDGWVLQDMVFSYMKAKNPSLCEKCLLLKQGNWLSSIIENHDILGRFQWDETQGRVRSTHAHRGVASGLYEKIIRDKENWMIYDWNKCFSGSQKSQKEEAEAASGTSFTSLPRFAWIQSPSFLRRFLPEAVDRESVLLSSLPGIRLLLPKTVTAALHYPHRFLPFEQLDEDFSTVNPLAAASSLKPNAAVMGEEGPVGPSSQKSELNASCHRPLGSSDFLNIQRISVRDPCRSAIFNGKVQDVGNNENPGASMYGRNGRVSPSQSVNAGSKDRQEDEEEEDVAPDAVPSDVFTLPGFLRVDLALLSCTFDLYRCPTGKVIYAFRRQGELNDCIGLKIPFPSACMTGEFLLLDRRAPPTLQGDVHSVSSPYFTQFGIDAPATSDFFLCRDLEEKYRFRCEAMATNNGAVYHEEVQELDTERLRVAEERLRKQVESFNDEIQILEHQVETFLSHSEEKELILRLPSALIPCRKRYIRAFMQGLIKKNLIPTYVELLANEPETQNKKTSVEPYSTAAPLKNGLLVTKVYLPSEEDLQELYKELELPRSLDREIVCRAFNSCSDNSKNYQEYEFIGDAVLGCIFAVDSFLVTCRGLAAKNGSRRFPLSADCNVDASNRLEGVSTACCNKVLRYLLPPVFSSQFAKRNFKVAADIVEALIGAVYDGECGMDACRRVVFHLFQSLSSLIEKIKSSPMSSGSDDGEAGENGATKESIKEKSTESGRERTAYKYCGWSVSEEDLDLLIKALILSPYECLPEKEETSREEGIPVGQVDDTLRCGMTEDTLAASAMASISHRMGAPEEERPFFGFVYGKLTQVIPKERCLLPEWEKCELQHASEKIREETKLVSALASLYVFPNSNVISSYAAVRGFCRVSLSFLATHFTSGDLCCYRRILEEEIPHIQHRILFGVENVVQSSNVASPTSMITYVNEVITDLMRFVVDFDSCSIYSWEFLRHFLEWVALRDSDVVEGRWSQRQALVPLLRSFSSGCGGGGGTAGHMMSGTRLRASMEDTAEEETSCEWVNPSFLRSGHAASKVLLATSCGPTKDSYHIHVLHWIIPLDLYKDVITDLELYILYQRMTLLLRFRRAVQGGRAVCIENNYEEKELDGVVSSAYDGGSLIEQTSHLWLPFLDPLSLFHLRNAFMRLRPAPDLTPDERASVENLASRHRSGARLGEAAQQFLKRLSPWHAARLFAVHPAHIFLGEVNETTKQMEFGVYQIQPRTTVAHGKESSSTAPTLSTPHERHSSSLSEWPWWRTTPHRWIIGKTITDHWKAFTTEPIPRGLDNIFTQLEKMTHTNLSLPSPSNTSDSKVFNVVNGVKPSAITALDRFWVSYVDCGLASSKKLRQMYCDKYDQKLGRVYRPVFPMGLASAAFSYTAQDTEPFSLPLHSAHLSLPSGAPALSMENTLGEKNKEPQESADTCPPPFSTTSFLYGCPRVSLMRRLPIAMPEVEGSPVEREERVAPPMNLSVSGCSFSSHDGSPSRVVPGFSKKALQTLRKWLSPPPAWETCTTTVNESQPMDPVTSPLSTATVDDDDHHHHEDDEDEDPDLWPARLHHRASMPVPAYRSIGGHTYATSFSIQEAQKRNTPCDVEPLTREEKSKEDVTEDPTTEDAFLSSPAARLLSLREAASAATPLDLSAMDVLTMSSLRVSTFGDVNGHLYSPWYAQMTSSMMENGVQEAPPAPAEGSSWFVRKEAQGVHDSKNTTEEEDRSCTNEIAAGIALDTWRNPHSTALAPPARWNEEWKAHLHLFDWTADMQEEVPQMHGVQQGYPTLTTRSSVATFQRDDPADNDLMVWISGLFLMGSRYIKPVIRNAIDMELLLKKEEEDLFLSKANPQCLVPTWLEQDLQTNQWRFVVNGEILVQTPPVHPLQDARTITSVDPPQSTSEVERNADGTTFSVAAPEACHERQEEHHSQGAVSNTIISTFFCEMIQRLMQLLTPHTSSSQKEIHNYFQSMLVSAEKWKVQWHMNRQGLVDARRGAAMEVIPASAGGPSGTSPSAVPCVQPSRVRGKFVHFTSIKTPILKPLVWYTMASPGSEKSGKEAFVRPSARWLQSHPECELPLAYSTPVSSWCYWLKEIAMDQLSHLKPHQPPGNCLIVLASPILQKDGNKNLPPIQAKGSVSSPPMVPMAEESFQRIASVAPHCWKETEVEGRLCQWRIHHFHTLYFLYEESEEEEQEDSDDALFFAGVNRAKSVIRTFREYMSRDVKEWNLVLCPYAALESE